MIDRQCGLVVFECDGCSETLETETSNWDGAKNIFDRSGWKSRPLGGGDWGHYCRQCRHVMFRSTTK